MPPYKTMALPSMCLLSQIDLFHLEQEIFPMSAPHSPEWVFLSHVSVPKPKLPAKSCSQKFYYL